MSEEQMNPYDLLIEVRENKILYQYFSTGAVILKDDGSWLLSGDSDHGESKMVELSTGVFRINLPLPYEPGLPLEALEKIILSLQGDMEGILMVEFIDDKPCVLYCMHTTLEGLEDGLRKFLDESKEYKNTISSLMKSVEEMKAQMSAMSEKMQASSGGSTGHKKPTKDLEENTAVWGVVGEIDKTRDSFPPLEPEDLGEDLPEDDEIDLNPPRPFEDDVWDDEDPDPNDPGPF